MLINRNHTYPDLYLPVDAEEMRWVEKIDGIRPIAEIIGSSSSQRENGEQLRARAFFELLWSYDQVIFDTSSCQF